jgi:predicted ATPase
MSSIWVVVATRQSYEDYRNWYEEESWQTIERGYFTSQEDAQDWIERTEEEGLVKARAEHAEQERLRRHQQTQSEARRKARVNTQQREYDALREAGLKPSFKRPDDFIERKFKPVEFDEKLWLRGQGIRYSAEEIKPWEES